MYTNQSLLFCKNKIIGGWQKLWLYLLFRCHSIFSIVLLILKGGTLWNCIFLGDLRMSNDYSMLSSNITPNSFLFWNFSEKSVSCPLQCLLKQCTWWLDQHFWHPFWHWPFSFLQQSILSSENVCVGNIDCHSFSPRIPKKYDHYFLFCSCYRDIYHLKAVTHLLLSQWIPFHSIPWL